MSAQRCVRERTVLAITEKCDVAHTVERIPLFQLSNMAYIQLAASPDSAQELKKKSPAVLLATLLGLGTSVAVQAQGSEWERLNAEASSLYKQGRYDQAVVAEKKALQVAEQNLGPDHPTVATLLNNLARLYDEQGQYAQAKPLYKRLLAMSEKALGPDHPDVATALNNLAGLYKAQGKYAQAEPLYKRSLAIWEKALGPDHPDVATVLSNLAAVYRKTGREKEAKALEDRARVIVAIKR